MRTVVSAIASLGLLGCMSSSSGSRHATYQEGDTTARPSLESLPSLDVELSTLTPEMRMARMLSAESLNLDPPSQPHDTSGATFSAWSDQELKDWIGDKSKRAEAARHELDRAAEQSHRQRIMAGALVGLVYEDMARTLLALPVPVELASEPEIAAMYVDLMHTQAAPYLVHSRQAYAACAGNAEQLPALRHWSEFCTTREERLPSGSLAEHKSPPPPNRVSIYDR